MLHIQIADNTEAARAIKAAAAEYDLDPNAFASGLVNAVLHKKTQHAQEPEPTTQQPVDKPTE